MKKVLITFSLFVLAVCTNTALVANPLYCASTRADYPSRSAEEILEEEPAADLSTPIDNQDKVTIKVFDIHGTLVLQKQVTMQELFEASLQRQHLPKGSIFVYFSQHTAYYFLDTPSN
jgi:hypothetical protein